MKPGPSPLFSVIFALGLILNLIWFVSAFLPRTQPQEALRYFDSGFLTISQRHARLAYINSGLESMGLLILAYIVGRSSFSFPVEGGLRFLRKGVSSLTFARALGIGALMGIFVALILALIGLPFRIYGGFYLEKAFGLSKESIWSFLLNYGKGSLLNIIVYVVSGAFLAAMFQASGRWWVIPVTLGFLALSFFGAFIYPKYVAPMFDTVRPLEEGPVAEEVTRLSQEAGMKVDQVMVLEASKRTTRVNAYFAGIGPTKEVVLYDTLLKGHSLGEVRLVLAHELGHWKYGHIWKGIVASTVGTFLLLSIFYFASTSVLGFGVRGGLPFTEETLKRYLLSFFAFLIIASYISNPFGNLLSRRFEAQADAFSLQLTSEPNVFIATQVSLATKNLSDIDPPPFIKWFSWTHPSTLDRIRMAEK